MSTGFLGDQILAVGHAFSIVGLIMAPISTLCCRMYSRILDMCQILYLFAIVLAPMTEKFSIYLDWSWLYWMPAFLPCKEYIKSSYVCSQGNLLSVLIILVGVIIVTFIIVKIFACNRENLTFSPFYSFLKGFFRWIYIPLVFNSALFLMNSRFELNNDIIGAIIILAFFVILWFIEVIGYKVGYKEGDHAATKWVYFVNHWMVCTIAVLLALGFSYNSQIPYYFIYVIKAIYEIIYLCAYNFTVGPLEKFVFLLGEAIFIVIFSLFLFKSDSIPENELDFFALAILIVIDIFIFFPKFFIYACQKPTEPIADNQNAGYEPPQTSNEHLYRQ